MIGSPTETDMECFLMLLTTKRRLQDEKIKSYYSSYTCTTDEFVFWISLLYPKADTIGRDTWNIVGN